MWSKQVSIIWRLVKRETRVLKGDHVFQANVAIRARVPVVLQIRPNVFEVASRIIALPNPPTKKIDSPSVLHTSLDLSKFPPNRKLSIYINETASRPPINPWLCVSATTISDEGQSVR